MTRVWFTSELETVATFWRVMRRDGWTLGFTTHDRDVWLDGIYHLASPGMVPSSLRKAADFSADSAEVEGALAHEAISAADLAAGRFDDATILIGLVDWVSGESETLYRGRIGTVSEEDGQFTAQLQSRKEDLSYDPNPRTSPSCRAEFCGPGCNLNPEKFTRLAAVSSFDANGNSVSFADINDAAPFEGGEVRWLEGPFAGQAMRIVAMDEASGLVLDAPLDRVIAAGIRVRLREGCDHTLDTCDARFGNAANFRGEPYLPGNDLLTRYPTPAS